MVSGAVPGLVVLGSIKQAEKVKDRRPVSSTLHGLCISSSLQVPVLLEVLPSLLLMMNFSVEL